jgi:hypothetical protein
MATGALAGPGNPAFVTPADGPNAGFHDCFTREVGGPSQATASASGTSWASSVTTGRSSS